MIQVELSQQKRDNLLKLATYLWEHAFDIGSLNMRSFQSCAVAYAPAAGLGHIGEYGYTDFITDSLLNSTADAAYYFLFHDDWNTTDKTPKGAAQRILFLLRYGVPDNYLDQRDGLAPLCYTDITL